MICVHLLLHHLQLHRTDPRLAVGLVTTPSLQFFCEVVSPPLQVSSNRLFYVLVATSDHRFLFQHSSEGFRSPLIFLSNRICLRLALHSTARSATSSELLTRGRSWPWQTPHRRFRASTCTTSLAKPPTWIAWWSFTSRCLGSRSWKRLSHLEISMSLGCTCRPTTPYTWLSETLTRACRRALSWCPVTPMRT